MSLIPLVSQLELNPTPEGFQDLRLRIKALEEQRRFTGIAISEDNIVSVNMAPYREFIPADVRTVALMMMASALLDAVVRQDYADELDQFAALAHEFYADHSRSMGEAAA